jgi:hypothetical protein
MAYRKSAFIVISWPSEIFSMPEISQANNYLLSSDQLDKIVISTGQEGRGWVVQALFPRHTSDEDKTQILKWMLDYRSQIRDSHPLWDVSFRPGKDRYCLFVTPEGCEADMKRTGRNKANLLFDELD